MGLFNRKDWNIIAIIFERGDLYTVNGNRSKGKEAEPQRDGAKRHERTIHWAVVSQKGAVIEDGPGPSQFKIDPKTYEKLKQDFLRNNTVREVLQALERGSEKVAKKMIWAGYPLPEKFEEEEKRL